MSMSETDPNIENFFNFGKKPSISEVLSKPKDVQPVKEDFRPEPIRVEKREPALVQSPKDNPNSVSSDRSGMQYVGEIPNIPTRSEYPSRVFDSYVKKDARLVENDLIILKSWSDRISQQRRKLGLNKGSENRITDNTILRIILSEFCNRFSEDFYKNRKEVTSEEELKNRISEIMSSI